MFERQKIKKTSGPKPGGFPECQRTHQPSKWVISQKSVIPSRRSRRRGIYAPRKMKSSLLPSLPCCFHSISFSFYDTFDGRQVAAPTFEMLVRFVGAATSRPKKPPLCKGGLWIVHQSNSSTNRNLNRRNEPSGSGKKRIDRHCARVVRRHCRLIN